MCQNHVTEFRILTWKFLQDTLLHRSQHYLKSIPRGFSQNFHFNFLFPPRTYSQLYIATPKPHKVIWTKKLEGSLPSTFRTITLLLYPWENSQVMTTRALFLISKVTCLFWESLPNSITLTHSNTEPPWLPEIAPSLIYLNRVRFHHPKNVPCATD